MEQVPEKLDEKLINQLSALFGQIAKGEMQRNRIERDPGIARKNRIIIQTLSKSNTHTHTRGRREKCSPNGKRGIENVFGKTLSLQQTEKIYICIEGMVHGDDDG